ncbi:MAG: pentapeptide repeat-containing protein [Candidatus Competibacter sp.]|nr:pentapeptide repeat-containing protein [Candidatus Competibacter sp.]
MHIFPYTYYLVGCPSAVVGALLGLVVSVTLVVLPLATLLALQLKFLAYQAEGITWAQRVAVFLDVGFLVVLWPAILHRSDDWKTWWRETLAAYLPKKRAWLAMIVLVASVVLILFAATPDLFAVGLIFGAMVPLLLIVLVGGFSDERLRRAIFLLVVLLGLLAVLWALIWGSESSLPSIQPVIPVALFLAALPLAFFWHPTAPRGSLALLSASILAPLLTLGLMVDGEFSETAVAELQKPLLDWQMLDRQDTNKHRGTLAQQFENDRCASIGQTVLSCVVLDEQRRLDLNEQALFAKPPSPELLAALRAGKGLENKDKLERISLLGRSLRRAQMGSVLLVGADLRGARFQGAVLLAAQLQGADLQWAQLQGAFLLDAQLQGVVSSGARFQGADLSQARLQGADLRWAQLQGAVLSAAQLQGADLSQARLQGADLRGAQLQGADLSAAQLQGVDLRWAQLQGADLSQARLQDADLSQARLQGADLSQAWLYRNGNPSQSKHLDIRGVIVQSLSQKESLEFQSMLKSISSQPVALDRALQCMDAAAKPGAEAPMFDSCLTDQNSQLKCKQTYDAIDPDRRQEFMTRLHESLVTLACEDTDIARGFLRQIRHVGLRSSDDLDSTRIGLATVLLARMKANEPCPDLAGLSAEDKAELERLAKKEAERQQAAKATSAGQ